ncbi:MAG TPA: hypothetical protein VD906_09035, partial [Caulobacteraceae bacterium]|nr:hypothetical protein [Caulobacteraceae bacterium]
TKVREDQLFVSYTPVQCNWLQGVDATVDSAHVGILHQSWVATIAGNSQALISANLAPRYEVQDRDYGIRAVALRDQADGSCYARIGEFVAPFFMFIGTSNSAAGERTLFINVPVDDHNCFLVLLRYTIEGKGPLTTGPGSAWDPEKADLDNFASVSADGWLRWGQNRNAMDEGHFTGFDGNLLSEDVAVQVSMGPIVDRTKEFLSTSDVGIVRARRMLLKTVRDFQAGKPPRSDIQYGAIRADAILLPPGEKWQDRMPR